MECSSFFFGSAEELDRAVSLARRGGVEGRVFAPTPADPAIRVYAFSVERGSSARAKELFISSGLPPIGFYDLPQEERSLPQKADASVAAPAEAALVGAVSIAFVAQCYADPRKTRLIAHHDADVAHLLPYLNAVMKSARYNSGAPTLAYKKGVRMITLYPNKVAVAKADDLLDAWLCLKEVKDAIHHVHQRANEITPDYHESAPPTPLDIYRLLPQTNCGSCNEPGCLAFAARLAAGESNPDECPLLKEREYAERRFKLFELMGESP